MSDTKALKMEFDNLCKLWGDLGAQIDTLQAKRREVSKRMDQAKSEADLGAHRSGVQGK